MNIVVLAGGLSTERDVSFVTGTNVAKALRNKGHQVLLLDVFMGLFEEEQELNDAFERAEELSLHVDKIPEVAPDLETVKAQRKDQSPRFFGPNVLQLCQKADIVFLALHGENGENGKVQAVFDLFGIRYTGTGYLGSALSMDKGLTKLVVSNAGVPVPNGVVISKGQSVSPKYPCVVKPLCGGSSVGVSIVEKEEELAAALDTAFACEDEVVIEDYVKGREFSVGVISGKALPIIEIAPIEGFYDYVNKYKAGSAVETCPALISEEKTKEMQHYAEMAAEALGLNTYSRIDFLMNEQEDIFCLEANTLPGMTPTSLLPQEAREIGWSFEELCEKLIQISCEK